MKKRGIAPRGSAYREQTFRELCVVCRERSSADCPRCGRPLCEEHRAERRARCQACEKEYQHLVLERLGPRPIRASGDRRRASLLAGLAGLEVVLFLYEGSLWLSALILVLFGWAILMTLTNPNLEKELAWKFRERRLRRRFLDERAPLPRAPDHPQLTP